MTEKLIAMMFFFLSVLFSSENFWRNFSEMPIAACYEVQET